MVKSKKNLILKEVCQEEVWEVMKLLEISLRKNQGSRGIVTSATNVTFLQTCARSSTKRTRFSWADARFHQKIRGVGLHDAYTR